MRQIFTLSLSLLALGVAGCGGAPENVAAGNGANASATAANETQVADFAWPEALRIMGEGYPRRGNPCRLLGESPATVNFLDDSADLIGCPGGRDGAAAQAIVAGENGRVTGEAFGVALISVPREAGAPAEGQRTGADGDALVAGTGFNATGAVRCVTRAGRSARECNSGVVRNRDGSATLTIFWPEGRSRAIFFGADGAVTGADTNQADGSAGYEVAGRRDNDTIIVTIGPERYEIPDVMILGD